MATGYCGLRLVFAVVLRLQALKFSQAGGEEIKTAQIMENVTFNPGSEVFSLGFESVTLKKNGSMLAEMFIFHHEFHVRYQAERLTIGEPTKRDQPIENLYFSLSNVQENDSDIYTLEGWHRTEIVYTWALYVLDMSEKQYNTQVIKEGDLMTNNDFPTLSDEVMGRMKLSTAWTLPGENAGSQNMLTIARHEMHNQTLTYAITNLHGNTTLVEYLLNITYVKNIVFEPKQNPLVINEGEEPPAVRCMAECNPKCNFLWMRSGNQVSHTDTLSLGNNAKDLTGEYICCTSNGRDNRKSLFVFYKEKSLQTTVTILGIFVGLLSAATLALIAYLALRLQLCVNRCPFTKTSFDNNVEMGLDNIAVDTLGESYDSSPTNYQDLQISPEQAEPYQALYIDNNGTIPDNTGLNIAHVSSPSGNQHLQKKAEGNLQYEVMAKGTNETETTNNMDSDMAEYENMQM